MLTLYHHGSSACAAKVRLALAEKELPWTGRYVDILRGEQFLPEFRTLNPKAVVPVLVHDAEVITESTVICEYLEDAFTAHAIFPPSPLARARVRSWTKAVDEELHPACSALTYIVSHRHTILRNGVRDFDDFLKRGPGEGLAARALKWQWIEAGFGAPGAAEKLRLYLSYLQKMEAALAGSDWLIGDQLSMADIAMAPYVNRLAALAMERLWEDARLPRVTAWFARMRARETFKTALVDWMPADLATEMRANGQRSWPEIERLIS